MPPFLPPLYPSVCSCGMGIPRTGSKRPPACDGVTVLARGCGLSHAGKTTSHVPCRKYQRPKPSAYDHRRSRSTFRDYGPFFSAVSLSAGLQSCPVELPWSRLHPGLVRLPNKCGTRPASVRPPTFTSPHHYVHNSSSTSTYDPRFSAGCSPTERNSTTAQGVMCSRKTACASFNQGPYAAQRILGWWCLQNHSML